MGGKSSSQTIGYKYYASLMKHIGSRIETMLGVNFDKRKWLMNPEDKRVLGIDEPWLYGETEGGVSGEIEIHIGTPDQLPSAHYLENDSLASGYPYESYLIFRNFYHGNTNTMRECLLWPKRTRVQNDGSPQWYQQRDSDSAIVCEIGAVGEQCYYVNAEYSNNGIWWKRIGNTASSPIQLSATTSVRINATHEKGRTYIEYRFKCKTALMITMPFGELLLKSADNIVVTSSEYIAISGGVSIEYKDRDINYWSEVVKFNDVKINKNNTDEHWIRVEFEFVEYVSPVHPSGLVSDLYSTWFQTLQGEDGWVCPETKTPDINPIHKIREILTNPSPWGMNKPELDINDDNFKKAADRIYDDGLGISWAVNDKNCIEAINELCYHFEGGARVNRQTGQYEIVLFRNDWFSEDEIHTLPQSKIKSIKPESKSIEDISNQVNVSFYNRDEIKNGAFSIADVGLIKTVGNVVTEDVKFPYFQNFTNAEKVAQWKLKQMSTGTWSGSFTTGYKEARKWNRYDLLWLEWSRKWDTPILVRIMSIGLGVATNNTVTIEFEEVVQHSGMGGFITFDESEDTGVLPPQPNNNAIFEVPYYLLVLAMGQRIVNEELAYNADYGIVGAVAEKPQDNSLYAIMQTNDGTGWNERATTVDYVLRAETEDGYSRTDTVFTVSKLPTVANELALIDDEWVVVESIDALNSQITVKRGALDTIPKVHFDYLEIFYSGSYFAYDAKEYQDGDEVLAYVLTTTPSGVQSANGPAEIISLNSRAIRPYPPANVKINNEYWPEEVQSTATVTWADRNRVQQTSAVPLGWYEPSVTLEDGVTYNFETRNDSDVVLASGDNVASGMVLDVADFYPEAMLSLWSVRDGYESMEKVEILLVSAIGVLNNFIDPIYAKGEVVKLIPKLSNGVTISSMTLASGSLPTGWSIVNSEIVGSATTDATYNFTVGVTDVDSNVIQKTFSVKVQGTTWAQLTFNSQNMADTVSGNTWTQGTGNTFVASPDGYAFRLGGTSAATLAKSFTSTTSFTMSARIKLTKLATDYIPLIYLGNASDNANRDCIYIIPENGRNVLRDFRQAGSGTSASFNAPSPIEIGEWVDVAYEISGVNQKLFVNKQLVSSSVYSNSISSFANAYIGLVRANSAPVYRDGVEIDSILITTGASRYE